MMQTSFMDALSLLVTSASQAWRIATPLGRERHPPHLWTVTFGWVLFLLYLAAGLLNCLTLIGIPLGLQSFKLAGISFWPVGRRVVTVELASLVRKDAAARKLAQYRDTPTRGEAAA